MRVAFGNHQYVVSATGAKERRRKGDKDSLLCSEEYIVTKAISSGVAFNTKPTDKRKFCTSDTRCRFPAKASFVRHGWELASAKEIHILSFRHNYWNLLMLGTQASIVPRKERI
jgi:hypothetical protein